MVDNISIKDSCTYVIYAPLWSKGLKSAIVVYFISVVYSARVKFNPMLLDSSNIVIDKSLVNLVN